MNKNHLNDSNNVKMDQGVFRYCMNNPIHTILSEAEETAIRSFLKNMGA